MPSAPFAAYAGPWRDPEDVFAVLQAQAPHAVWLDDVAEVGWSWIGTGSRLLTHVPAPAPQWSNAAARDGAPRFRPGWMGWLEYEGQARFLEVDTAIGFDHDQQQVWIAVAGAGPDDAAWRAVAALVDTAPHLMAPPLPAIDAPLAAADWRHGDPTYRDLILACQAAIGRGDAYQLCLTNTAQVRASVDPWQVYRRLRRVTRTHHGGFLRLGDTTLLSASPEQFLAVAADGRIHTKPIKGTRPRGGNEAEDAALHAELLASVKERAENVMIVDLMRNDLARVCEVGSVHVPVLLQVESYPTVHQLVSTIAGRLASDRGIADGIAALFPAGSMTGAPKERAIELLAELEAGPRGIYSGVFGWIGADGQADLAMVIRSIVLTEHGVSIGAGGGITALSDPDQEVAEFHLKAAALLRVLAAADAAGED